MADKMTADPEDLAANTTKGKDQSQPLSAANSSETPVAERHSGPQDALVVRLFGHFLRAGD